MWTIRLESYNGVTADGQTFRTKEEAVCALFDAFTGFPKPLWQAVGNDKIVNHTCSGDNVYSVVQI